MAFEIYPGQIDCRGQFLGHNRKKYYVYSCEMIYSYEKKRFLIENERVEVNQSINNFYQNVGQMPMIDAGFPKTQGEFLVVGNCYNNYADVADKTTSAIAVKLGEMERKFIVFGDRRWIMDASMSWAITPPEPFEKMPIASKFAFGGAKFLDNPLGRGFETEELPNVELPGQVIISKNDKPKEATLDAISMLAPIRKELAGSMDANWSKFVAPDYPDDLKWEYFNVAPLEQRKQGYFKGNEAYEIVNMDPFKRKVEGILPNVYMRSFYSFKEHPEVLVPGEMFLDTITFIPEKASVSMIWRLTIEVKEEQGEDLAFAMFAYENHSDEPRSFDYYKRDFEWRKNQIKVDNDFKIMVTSPLVANGDKSAKVIEYETTMEKSDEKKEDKYANEKTEDEKELDEKLAKAEKKRNKRFDKLKEDLKSGENITKAYDDIIAETSAKSSNSLAGKLVVAEVSNRKEAALKAHQEIASQVSLLSADAMNSEERKKAKEKNYTRKNTDIYEHINAIDSGDYELFFGLNDVDESLDPSDLLNSKIDRVIPYYTIDPTLVYGDDVIVKKEELVQTIGDDFNRQEQIKTLMKSKEVLEQQKKSYMDLVDEQAKGKNYTPLAIEKAKQKLEQDFINKTKDIDTQIEEVASQTGFKPIKQLADPNKMNPLFRDKDNLPKLSEERAAQIEQQYSELEEMLDNESMQAALFDGYSPEKIKEAVEFVKKTRLNPVLIAEEARREQDATGFDFKAQYRPVAHNYPRGASPHEIDEDTLKNDFFNLIEQKKIANKEKGEAGYIDMTNGDYACIDLRESDLNGIDFSGCYFEQVIFDEADLKNCIFDGAIMVRCSFFGTEVSGTSFEGANLGDSQFMDVDFKNTRFNKETIVDKCYFENCIFDYFSFDEVPYSQIIFEKCEFNSVEIYKSMFNEVSFLSCKIGRLDCLSAIITDCFIKDTAIKKSSWHRANFSGTVFADTDFQNGEFSFIGFSNMSIENCKFIKNKFLNCSFGLGNLSSCKFIDAEIASCSLDNASFYKCDFTGADLSNSSFSKSVIKFTNFFMANLMSSTFRYANVKNTDFSFANLWLADFAKVTLGECTFTGANTKDTIFDGWKP